MRTLLLAAGFVLAASQAMAAQCGPRADVVGALAEGFGEVPHAIGVQNERLIEIFASDDGATWTIILTSPQMLSCVMAAGTDFMLPIEAAPIVPGDDS